MSTPFCISTLNECTPAAWLTKPRVVGVGCLLLETYALRSIHVAAASDHTRYKRMEKYVSEEGTLRMVVWEHMQRALVTEFGGYVRQTSMCSFG